MLRPVGQVRRLISLPYVGPMPDFNGFVHAQVGPATLAVPLLLLINPTTVVAASTITVAKHLVPPPLGPLNWFY